MGGFDKTRSASPWVGEEGRGVCCFLLGGDEGAEVNEFVDVCARVLTLPFFPPAAADAVDTSTAMHRTTSAHVSHHLPPPLLFERRPWVLRARCSGQRVVAMICFVRASRITP